MKRILLFVLLLSMIIAESGSYEKISKNSSITEGIEIGRLSTRDKRDSNFQLDQSEIARQNQITKQIFANYLERRLFPNLGTSQKIPTIAEILPKLTTTTKRPRPRGFASSSLEHNKRKNTVKKTYHRSGHNRFRDSPQKHNKHNRDVTSEPQLVDEAGDAIQLEQQILEDDVDFDGQESLQSVESEQHDQYYSEIFNRDPSENEIESGNWVTTTKTTKKNSCYHNLNPQPQFALPEYSCTTTMSAKASTPATSGHQSPRARTFSTSSAGNDVEAASAPSSAGIGRPGGAGTQGFNILRALPGLQHNHTRSTKCTQT